MRTPTLLRAKTKSREEEGIAIDDSQIKRKIENAVEGLPSQCFNYLCVKISPISQENAVTICDYMSSLKSEINPSSGYRKNTIILLSTFSIFFKNAKMFKDIAREDLLSFLDSFRKVETVDPLHKWIGTYNLYRTELMRFVNDNQARVPQLFRSINHAL